MSIIDFKSFKFIFEIKKSMRIVFLIPLLFLFTCCKKEKLNSYVVSQGSGVYDIDSNFYKTVKIGETEWMAENLRVSSLNNGQKITEAIKKKI